MAVEWGEVTQQVRVGLERANIELAMVDDAFEALPGDCTGVVVYGSRARGDHRPDSDLDLLALVEHEKGSKSVGLVNVSCYTAAQLESASGTLFGIHLQRDGIVLFEKGQQVTRILAALSDLDVDRLLSRVHHFSTILNSSDADQHLNGVVRLGKYLLRSAIYAKAFADGRPCFSVSELAERHRDPDLVAVLSSGFSDSANLDQLSDLRERLAAIVGPLPDNPYLSIEGIAVSEWDIDRNRSTLAILAMGAGEGEEPFDYSLLPKVLL